VACDPEWADTETTLPFDLVIAPGTYPVVLSIAYQTQR
jgi:hypothetical protein